MLKGLTTIKRFFPALLSRAAGPQLKQMLLNSGRSPPPDYSLSTMANTPKENPQGNTVSSDQYPKLLLCIMSNLETIKRQPLPDNPAALEPLSTTTNSEETGNFVSSGPSSGPKLFFRNKSAAAKRQTPPDDLAALKPLSTTVTSIKESPKGNIFNSKGNVPQPNKPLKTYLCLVVRNFYSNNSKQGDTYDDPLSLKPKNQKTNFLSHSSDYEMIIENEGEDLIDKSTDLIKIHILSPSSMVTSYRRSGKSTMASMINAFYNIAFAKRVEELLTQKQVNSQDLRKEISETQHPYYQFFSKQKIGLDTSMMKEQGKYPVIYMEFIDIYRPGISFAGFYFLLLNKIQNTYEKYPYLKENPKYIKMMEMFEKVSQQNIDQISENNKGLIVNSLFILTQLLRNFHKERVIVLIDEYDSSFNEVLYQEFDLVCQKQISEFQYNALENPSPEQKEDHDEKIRILEQKKIQLSKLRMEIIRHIVSVIGPAFKYNKNLRKGILFGIFQTIFKNTESKLNNISVSNMINSDLSSSFGLQQEEVKNYVNNLFKQSQNRAKLLENIKKYCNGYTSRLKDENGKPLKIYNVFSTMNYIHSCFKHKKIVEYEQYWTQSGSTKIIKMFFRHNGLFFLKNRILSIDKDVSTPIQIQTNPDLAQFPFHSEQLSEKYIAYLLYCTGLITGEVKQGILQARIPNQQIKNIFKDEFMYWAKKSMGISEEPVNFLDLRQTIVKVHQHLVEYQRRVKPQLKETVLQTVVFALWIFSGPNKHALYQEKRVSTEDQNRCDHIFVPMKSINEGNKKAENVPNEQVLNQKQEGKQKVEETGEESSKANEQALKGKSQKEAVNDADKDGSAKKQLALLENDEKTVVIQEYKNLNEGKIQTLYIKGFWQILSRGYVRAFFKLEGKQYVPKYPSVKRIVLRSIVMANDKTTNRCFLYYNRNDVVLSIQEATTLANKNLSELKIDEEVKIDEKAVKAVFTDIGANVNLEGVEYGRVAEQSNQ